MIQEIYDYLLTRSSFMFNKEVMIKECDTKDRFREITHNVVELMQKENFFIVYPEALKNINDLVQYYRFNYNKDKEINDDMNFIIERTNEYKNMTYNRKRYLASEWLKLEFKDRNLPWICQTEETVTGAMWNEVDIFLTICGYTLSEDGKTYEYDDNRQEQETITDVYRYLQIINLLANRYPGFFYDEYNMQNTLYNLNSISEQKPTKLILKYVKRTLKNIKKLEKEVKELEREMIKEKGLK